MEFDPSWDALLKPGRANRFFQRSPRPELQSEVTGFSPATAWWLAELARLVYRPDGGEPATSSILHAAGLSVRQSFDIEGCSN